MRLKYGQRSSDFCARLVPLVMVRKFIPGNSSATPAQQVKNFVGSRVAQVVAKDKSSRILAITPGSECSTQVRQLYFGGLVEQRIQHRQAHGLGLRSSCDRA